MIYNAEEFGAFSLKWTLKAASLHVPRENLEIAFQAAIEYLDRLARYYMVCTCGEDGCENTEESEDEPDIAMMIDVCGQSLLTGGYSPTRFPDEGETGLYLADEPGDEPPISEADVTQFQKLLGYVPDGKEPNAPEEDAK